MPHLRSEYAKIRDWYIYKITSPSNRVYVGLTSDIKKREKDYRNVSCKSQSILYKSICKYGFYSHKLEIIDKFTSDTNYAYGKEIFWIRTNMSNSSKWPEMKGLNAVEGGRGSIGYKMSDETKEKLRQANLGKKYSQETKNKLSQLMKGKKMNRVVTDEQKKRISLMNKGRKHTDEAKKIIGLHSKGNKNCLGIKQTPERVANRVKSIIGNKWNVGRSGNPNQKKSVYECLRKAILQYDIDGNFIQEYPSMKEAASGIGISSWSIRECANGRVKNPTKFIFKFKEKCL